MSRGLSAANAAAIAARHIRPITFLELAFPSGTMRVHNAIGKYSWGGNDWFGAGALLSIAPLEESDSLSPYRVTYQLSGITSAILSAALSEQIYERVVVRYDGFLDTSGALVDTPHETRRDYMDTMEIRRGGEMDVILLHCESEHIRDKRPPGRMFSDEDQQRAYPGDNGFAFVPQLSDATISWGGGERVTFRDPAPSDTRPRAPRRGVGVV